jgi:hypothetical protein
LPRLRNITHVVRFPSFVLYLHKPPICKKAHCDLYRLGNGSVPKLVSEGHPGPFICGNLITVKAFRLLYFFLTLRYRESKKFE